MQQKSYRKFGQMAAVGLLAMIVGSTTSAVAGSGFPATGLGLAQPSAPDVSSNPRWHVYAFLRSGVRYYQISDLNGQARAAFAVQGKVILALPVGTDADIAATKQEPHAAVPAGTTSETVYSDNVVTVAVAVLSGTSVLSAAVSTGDCTDPIECTSHVVSASGN